MIARGAHGGLLLLLPFCCACPGLAQPNQPPAVSRLKVSLVSKGQAPAAPGQITLGSRAGAASRALAWEGEPLVAEVPAGSSWELTAEIPGSWVAAQALIAGAAGDTVEVVVAAWPASAVVGWLKLPAGDPFLPSLLLATVEASPVQPRPRPIGRGSASCPVDSQGKFVCSLPAGPAIDVAFRVEGYVPQYRWGMELVANESHEVGPLLLVEGASLSGWLTTAEGDFEAAKAEARLWPMQATQGEPRASARLRATAFDAKPRADGFFQFSAVPPGRYTLEGKYPGFATARVFPVEVVPGRESAIREAVALHRPLTLELALDPPLDWMGKPWRVVLSRSADLSGAQEPGPSLVEFAPPSGLLRIPDQAPGRFEIHVSDSLHNPFFFEIGREVRGQEDARIAIQLRVLKVEGTLTLGGEPLAGSLIFGTRFGALHSAMEADSAGRFIGVLPKDGTWQVEVIAEQPSLEAEARVQVQAGEPVLVELPNTSVHGVVVDEEERAVPGAQVSIQTLSSVRSRPIADGEGRFEARALPEGPLRLLATHATPQQKLSSDVHHADLSADEPLGPVRLLLRERRSCVGRVLSSFGPVPGAAVVAVFSSNDPQSADSLTDLEGRYSLDVHHGVSSVELLV